MNKEDLEVLQKACEPIIKYINENHDPHTQVIITQESIQLLKTEAGIPMKR